MKTIVIGSMQNETQREQKRDLKMNRFLMTCSTSSDPIYIEFIELLFPRRERGEQQQQILKNILICIHKMFAEVMAEHFPDS